MCQLSTRFLPLRQSPAVATFLVRIYSVYIFMVLSVTIDISVALERVGRWVLAIYDQLQIQNTTPRHMCETTRDPCRRGPADHSDICTPIFHLYPGKFKFKYITDK